MIEVTDELDSLRCGQYLLKEYRLAMRIEMNDRSSISLNAV